MRRLRVLMDVDGVLADIYTPTLKAIEQIGAGTWDPATWQTWDIFDTIGAHHIPAIEAIWATKGWCGGLEVLPGAVEGIAKLRELADIVFVTAPFSKSPNWMYERDQWIREHFGLANENEGIIHTSAKHMVRGDMLVDDKPSNVNKWMISMLGHGISVLWDAPYNQDNDSVCSHPDDLKPGVVRAKSWDDVLLLLQSRLRE